MVMKNALYLAPLLLVCARILLAVQDNYFKHDGFNRKPYTLIPADLDEDIVSLSMPNNRIHTINDELQNYPQLMVGYTSSDK